MHMHHFTILVLLCASPKERSNFELQYEKEALEQNDESFIGGEPVWKTETMVP